MRRSGFKGLVAAGVVATGMMASTTAVAASDIFLKMTGVVGESPDSKHKGEIEVLSWAWGTSNGDAQTRRGRLAPACIQHLHLTKPVDSASPSLIMIGVMGQVVPDGVMTVRKSGGDQQEFLTLKMTNIMVTSYQTGGSEHTDELTDQVSLHFETMRFEYRRQNQDGSLSGPITFEFSGGCPKK